MGLPRWSRVWIAPVFGAGLAVLLYSSSGRDDAHITLWSAHALAELGEIVNHGGARVEQSSSLLQTVLLALLHLTTGVALPWLAYLGGIAAAAAAIVRLPALARECGFELGTGSLVAAATAPAFAYWQLGMLETSLFTWCAVEFLIVLARLASGEGEVSRGAWTRAALVSAALAAVRPEAALVAVATAGTLSALIAWRGTVGAGARRTALVAAIAGGCLVLLILFRLAYFGAPFPQPVQAKMGGPSSAIVFEVKMGLEYLIDRLGGPAGAVLILGLIVGAAAGVRDLLARRFRRVAVPLFVLAYFGFVLTSGGDWMESWRFVAHVEPLVVFLLIQAVDGVLDGGRRRLVVSALIAANVIGMVQLSMTISLGRPLWTAWQVDPSIVAQTSEQGGFTWPERANQVHMRDLFVVGQLNELVARIAEEEERVIVMSKQAGLIPFYVAREHFGRFEFVDPLGLASDHLNDFANENEVPRGQLGFALDVRDTIRLGEGRSEPWFRPHVVYDIGEASAGFFSRNGYVVVYEQTGTARSAWTSREELADSKIPITRRGAVRLARYRERVLWRRYWRSENPCFEFLAVREDVARRLQLTDRQWTLDWDQARERGLRFLGGPGS